GFVLAGGDPTQTADGGAQDAGAGSVAADAAAKDAFGAGGGRIWWNRRAGDDRGPGRNDHRRYRRRTRRPGSADGHRAPGWRAGPERQAAGGGVRGAHGADPERGRAGRRYRYGRRTGVHSGGTGAGEGRGYFAFVGVGVSDPGRGRAADTQGEGPAGGVR